MKSDSNIIVLDPIIIYANGYKPTIDYYTMDWNDFKDTDWDIESGSAAAFDLDDPQLLVKNIPSDIPLGERSAINATFRYLGYIGREAIKSGFDPKQPSTWASAVGMVNDATDEMATTFSKANLSESDFKVARNSLIKINGAITAVLEAPEVIKAWNSGDKNAVQKEAIGVLDAVAGGGIGSYAGAAIIGTFVASIGAPALVVGIAAMAGAAGAGWLLGTLGETLSEEIFDKISNNFNNLLDSEEKRFADNIQGDINSDIIESGAGNDVVRSLSGVDIISSSEGNDTVYAGNSNDVIYGGSENDILLGEAGADRLDGGAGTDRAQYSTASRAVIADLQYAHLNTEEAKGDSYVSIENLYGSKYHDSLRGNTGDNAIWGADGNDALHGRDGHDALSGGNGNDVLYDNNGNDKLYGGSGNDTLNGGAGSDTMRGGAGDDVIYFANDDAFWTADNKALDIGGSGRDLLIVETGSRFSTGGLNWYGFEAFRGADQNDNVTGLGTVSYIACRGGVFSLVY